MATTTMENKIRRGNGYVVHPSGTVIARRYSAALRRARLESLKAPYSASVMDRESEKIVAHFCRGALVLPDQQQA
jgi:hypothetical protein